MATKAQMTLRVTKSRSNSAVALRTIGSYAGLAVNTIDLDLAGQPLYTTASAKDYWLAVLAAATAAVQALP